MNVFLIFVLLLLMGASPVTMLRFVITPASYVLGSERELTDRWIAFGVTVVPITLILLSILMPKRNLALVGAHVALSFYWFMAFILIWLG